MSVKFKLKHYSGEETLIPYMLECAFYDKRNCPLSDYETYPRNGFVVEDAHGEPICVGFLYMTDSALASIAHLASDPDYDKIDRQEATDFMLDGIRNFALGKGYVYITFSANIEKLGPRLEKLGFISGDRNLSSYLYVNERGL
jgi:hypothetical protein